MTPYARNLLITVVALILAVWVGYLVAEGSYALPAMAGAAAFAWILVRLTGLPADLILLGLVLVGYIVGNRGFAQFMFMPGLPLFPGEWCLAAGLGWLAVGAAQRRRLPWRHDALNWVLLLWLAVGTARVVIDVPHFGLMALRDYAMVYYAAFFFLAQHHAGSAPARRYLVSCLSLAVSLLLPVYYLSQLFPWFFFNVLSLRGVPLVYLKDDLAVTFLAVGGVLLFHAAPRRLRFLGWLLVLGMLFTVVTGNSRASFVGSITAVVWLTVARRWALPALQASLAGVVLIALLAASSLGSPWAEHKSLVILDRVASLVDPGGTRQYDNLETIDKGDNNRFRMVWWHTVAKETLSQAPFFGLGFGYDLAKGFLQVYDPEAGEDFTVRSPHSIVMSAFGRMGIVGLAAFVAIIGAMGFRTWHALHDPSTDPVTVGLWCSAWVILTSACFGVVLEGPMGAVVFWSVLGLANGSEAPTKGADDGNPVETANASELAQA